MLPRIVLLIIQIAAAWTLAGPIKSALPSLVGRQYDIFVYALLYAAIIMVVGFAGSLVLKNVRVPSVGTFVASLFFAVLLAAITLIPQIQQPIEEALPLLRTNRSLYPLIGAIVGYVLKR